MTVKFGDRQITSNFSHHSAAMKSDGSWTVTWLPGRTLTRAQATTAMMIAEAVRTHTDDLADNDSEMWGRMDNWAAELGVTGPHAVVEASLDPEDHGVADQDRAAGDEKANMRFLVTTAELGRAGTKVHVSAHGVGRDVDTAPFAVRGFTVRARGERRRGEAMAYFAEIIADLHAALNQRVTAPRPAEPVPPGMTPLPLELEPDCGPRCGLHSFDENGEAVDKVGSSDPDRVCLCPVLGRRVYHLEGVCSDPVVARVGWYATPAGYEAAVARGVQS
jgi:hypothetical protein